MHEMHTVSHHNISLTKMFFTAIIKFLRRQDLIGSYTDPYTVNLLLKIVSDKLKNCFHKGNFFQKP